MKPMLTKLKASLAAVPSSTLWRFTFNTVLLILLAVLVFAAVAFVLIQPIK